MGVIQLYLFKKVVDEADKIGVGAITLASRGEPTLHKDFSHMLDYLGNKENIFDNHEITSLLKLDIPTYDPDNLPEDLTKIDPVKPGSRKN